MFQALEYWVIRSLSALRVEKEMAKRKKCQSFTFDLQNRFLKPITMISRERN